MKTSFLLHVHVILTFHIYIVTRMEKVHYNITDWHIVDNYLLLAYLYNIPDIN